MAEAADPTVAIVPAFPAARLRPTTDALSLPLLIVCCALAAHALYYLLLGISSPALDLHSFRQTQVGLTAYWLWRGGPWLAYETPVLGAPWSLPFEFPLYQWLVAILREIGVPIDVGGRVVSFAFFVGCLWPLRTLFRTLGFPLVAYLIVAALYLASPIYLYWGRTVMIETCELFFCLAWLALLARFLEARSIAALLGAVVSGSLAMLVKSPTFPAFAVLGGLLVLVETYQLWRKAGVAACIPVLCLSAAAVAVPAVIGMGWIVFADGLKERGQFGALLTTSALFNWYFGTFGISRWSAAFWYDVVLRRAGLDIFGYGGIVAPFVIAATLLNRRYLLACLSLLVAFVVPFLISPNLHIVHNFYQAANALFLLTAAGLAVAGLIEGGWTRLAVGALTVILAGQLGYFHRRYAPIIAVDYTKDEHFQTAALVREKVPPGRSLIVLGDNWSPAIPYYSERKSLALPSLASTELMKRILQDPQAFLGDVPLGGIVYCPAGIELDYGERTPPDPDYSGRVALVKAFIADRTVLAEVGHNADGCQVLAPKAGR